MSKEIHGNSLYKEEYCQKIYDFFNKEPFEIYLIEDGKDKGKTAYTPTKLPTLEAFANSIFVHRDTLHEWSKNENKDKYRGVIKTVNGEEFELSFSDALKHAKQLQYDILVQNGLFGNYEKTFAKFVAVNVTDMRDKQEVHQTVTEAPIIEEDVPRE